MKRLSLLIVAAFAALLPQTIRAQQKWAVGTNVIDYVNMGTLNVEASLAVGKHITVNADAKVNPWTFHEGDRDNQRQNRSQTYSAGIRYWPWYAYSGWWISGKARYQEYNRGGFVSRDTEEGDAFGASLGFGYTMMLGHNVNLDFGVGVWGGRTVYTSYACPTCGRVTGQGAKWFVMPADIMAAFVFIF